MRKKRGRSTSYEHLRDKTRQKIIPTEFRYSWKNFGFFFLIAWIWIPFFPFMLADKNTGWNGLLVAFCCSTFLTLWIIVLHYLFGVKVVRVDNSEVMIIKGVNNVRVIFHLVEVVCISKTQLPRTTNCVYEFYLGNKQFYRFTDFGLKDKDATKMWSILTTFFTVKGQSVDGLESRKIITDEEFKNRIKEITSLSNAEQCKRQNVLKSSGNDCG